MQPVWSKRVEMLSCLSRVNKKCSLEGETMKHAMQVITGVRRKV